MMQDPVAVQPAEDSPRPTNKRKYVGWSVLAGFFYGVPTLLVGFTVSGVLIFFVSLVILPAIFPSLNQVEPKSFDLEMKLLIGLAVIVALVLALVAGLVSGRAAYKKANGESSFKQAGYGMASCAGIGLLGIFIFPILCYVGYFAIFALLNVLQLQNGSIAAVLSGGTDSGNALILLFCLPSIGILLAYITAMLFGPLVVRILKRKPKAEVQD
jgi:hypothetical protein